MADLKYKPAPHNHKAFLAKAGTRKGFTEAYETLDHEYRIAGQVLKARAVGCELQVRLVRHKNA